MHLSNPNLYNYLIPFSSLLISLGILKIIDYMISHHLRPKISQLSFIVGEVFYSLWSCFVPIGYFATLYHFFYPFLEEKGQTRLWELGEIIISIQLARLVIASMLYFFELSWKHRHHESNDLILKAMTRLLRFCAWILAALLSAQYLGYDISKALTGLGIAGVIASLAGQTILTDVFNYLVIYFDRPFEVGDFITTSQGSNGFVEYVGIKNTRLRALEGQLVILSNSHLMESNIQNHKKIEQRRVIFHLYLNPKSSLEILEKLGGWLQIIIESTEKAAYERAHLIKFIYSNPVFEIAYVISTGDYIQYLHINQSIHLKIKQLLEKQHIKLASPVNINEFGKL